jgi:hypothetical protein
MERLTESVKRSPMMLTEFFQEKTDLDEASISAQ